MVCKNYLAQNRNTFNPNYSYLTMQKRGQEVFGMSFGMIFSIILIIVFIAVAVYAILALKGMGECTELGTFYDDLQTEVTKVWRAGSGEIHKEFSARVPSKIEAVCFGNLTTTAISTADGKIQLKLNDEGLKEEDNVFLYPPENACDGDLSSYKLKHIKFANFFCANTNVTHRVNVTLDIKEEALVRINEA